MSDQPVWRTDAKIQQQILDALGITAEDVADSLEDPEDRIPEQVAWVVEEHIDTVTEFAEGVVTSAGEERFYEILDAFDVLDRAGKHLARGTRKSGASALRQAIKDAFKEWKATPEGDAWVKHERAYRRWVDSDNPYDEPLPPGHRDRDPKTGRARRDPGESVSSRASKSEGGCFTQAFAVVFWIVVAVVVWHFCSAP